MSKKRVAIIFGGQSSEHEVSRISAQSVIENIDRKKYDVEIIGITKNGQWLKYDGPVEKIGNGEWEDIAQKKLLGSNISANETPSDITTINSAKQVIVGNAKAPIDVVFPVLHGCNGEDGTIQGLFELAGIPYVAVVY